MSDNIEDRFKVDPDRPACHRKQPMLMPGPLGHLQLAHHPCLRDKCTLWHNAFGCCSDVNNAVELTSIRQKLQVIIDHLPPELP